jgi:hypothetical protein
VALLPITIASALADWGPLSTQPTDNQNTTWNAHCKDSLEHVVSGRCTLTDGSGTLQNVGVNDDGDTWTVWDGQSDRSHALRKMKVVQFLVRLADALAFPSHIHLRKHSADLTPL